MRAQAEGLLWRALDRILSRAALVVVAAVVLAAIALGYALLTLEINTSTEEMISADVPFRRDRIAFVQAFPEFEGPIVAVVEGSAPARVEQAAAALAAALRADDEHFAAIDYPAGDPFFTRHGLLYLDVEQLAALADRLAAAQPLLAALAADPSLRGLAAFVDLAVAEGDGSGALPAELDRLLGAMADAVEAQLAGRPGEVSWHRALQVGDGGESPLTRELIIAQPRFDQASLALAGPAIEALRARAADLEIDPAHGLDLKLTGAATLNEEELQSVRSGATLAAALTTVTVTGLLVWGLGSLRLIAATLITLTLGLIITAGFGALAIGRLNLISVTFAVLFVGLGVDFGIHVVLRYREALETQGEHRPALRHALAGVVGPLSLSALCAALGFLAFVPTEYRGLAELGIISAAGMAIAWLASLTLLPALLELMPLARPAQGAGIGLRPLRSVQRHPRVVVAITVLAMLVSLPAPAQLAFDFNPLNLKDPESESVRTFRALAADPTTSPDAIDVLAGSLAEADALAAKLRALNEVERALTLSSFVPEDQEQKLALIDDLAFYLGPILDPGAPLEPLDAEQRRQALESLRASVADAAAGGRNPGAAQLAVALDRFVESGPSAAALAELERRLIGTLPELLERLRQSLEAGPVTLGDLPQSLRERWLNAAGQARILVQPAANITDNAALKSFAQAVQGVAPHATGAPVILTAAGDAVIGAFREASWLALGLIALLLIAVLRRVRDIFLVLAPLGLAVLFTAASAVALGLRLNFANVIVLPLLLGLGVSGAIHVVMRWREEAEPETVATTSTPRAVLFSALTTIASFGSLALSRHLGLASMGLLLTIAILWSLVCTLLVLPSVLALIGKARRGSETP
jgi:hopanoid biosynthesis associated RND transporter like protein HpnN